jgi:hypothetical protein
MLIKRLSITAASLVMLAAPLVERAAAQEPPAPVVELSLGWIGFADDGIVNEGMLGGAGRWYLTPRIGVGPEIVYIDGSNHSHLMVTGNVTFDLLSPSTPRSVMPFVVAGGGLFRTRDTFLSDDFTSTEGAFTAGGGVRAFAGQRVMVGIDARVGWELHLRVNGFVGVRLGQ